MGIGGSSVCGTWGYRTIALSYESTLIMLEIVTKDTQGFTETTVVLHET